MLKYSVITLRYSMKIRTTALLTLITLSQTVLFVHNTLPMNPLPYFPPKDCCICFAEIEGTDPLSIVCRQSHSDGICIPCFKNYKGKPCPLCRADFVDYKTYYPDLDTHIDQEIKSFHEWYTQKGYKSRVSCSCCKKSYDENTLSTNPLTHMGCKGYNHFVCIECMGNITTYSKEARCPDCFQVIKEEKIGKNLWETSWQTSNALAFLRHTQASHVLALNLINDNQGNVAKEKICRICNKENDLSDFIMLRCGNLHKICINCLEPYAKSNTTCTLCIQDGQSSTYTIDAQEQNRLCSKRSYIENKKKNNYYNSSIKLASEILSFSLEILRPIKEDPTYTKPLPYFPPKECYICFENVMGIDYLSIADHEYRESRKGHEYSQLGQAIIDSVARKEGMCGPCFKQFETASTPFAKWYIPFVDYKPFYPKLNKHIKREIQSLPEGYKGRLACSCCKKIYDENMLPSNPITHLGCNKYNHFACIECLDKLPTYKDETYCPDCFQLIKPDKIKKNMQFPFQILAVARHTQTSHTLALKIIKDNEPKEETCRICNKENDVFDFVWFGCSNDHKICVYCMRTYLISKSSCCILCEEEEYRNVLTEEKYMRKDKYTRAYSIQEKCEKTRIKKDILKIKRKNNEGFPPQFTSWIVLDNYIKRAREEVMEILKKRKKEIHEKRLKEMSSQESCILQ